MKDIIEIGDSVKASPMGSGVVTGITAAGYPQVNHVAVAFVIMEDDGVFDPHGHTTKPDFDLSKYTVSH